MITEASCAHTLYGYVGSVRVRIDAEIVGQRIPHCPDLNGLLATMCIAAEEFVAKDKGVDETR